jgi:hypothetical protein
MRYKLRTLLIVAALAPPVLAVAWFTGQIINSLPVWLSAPLWVLLLAPLWVPLVFFRRFVDYAQAADERQRLRER